LLGAFESGAAPTASRRRGSRKRAILDRKAGFSEHREHFPGMDVIPALATPIYLRRN